MNEGWVGCVGGRKTGVSVGGGEAAARVREVASVCDAMRASEARGVRLDGSIDRRGRGCGERGRGGVNHPLLVVLLRRAELVDALEEQAVLGGELGGVLLLHAVVLVLERATPPLARELGVDGVALLVGLDEQRVQLEVRLRAAAGGGRRADRRRRRSGGGGDGAATARPGHGHTARVGTCVGVT